MPAEHPSLSLRVNDTERARAESLLSDAYAAGRLNEAELDQRLGMVLQAQTRRELNAAVVGLPRTPPVAFAAPAAPTNPEASVAGGIAHLSGLVSWIFGPLLLHVLASPGTVARREAARAFNFQFVAGLACIVVAVVAGVLLPGSLMGVIMTLGWVGWLALTVFGGARALAGQAWRNPVTRVVPLHVLDESGRR